MKCTFNKNSWGLCMFKKKNKFTHTHTQFALKWWLEVTFSNEIVTLSYSNTV